MKFIRFDLYSYAIPCSLWKEKRQGILLHGILENGEERFGELAPLPGFSREPLSEAYLQLTTLLSEYDDLEWEAVRKKHSLLPSVNFALYCLSLPNQSISAPLSGFVYLPRFEEEIPRLQSLGIKEAKIKIPSLPFSETIPLLKQSLQASNNSIYFHLDINRRWSLKEWREFEETFPKGAFHYIEEPVRREDLSFSMIKNSQHPVSLDESIREDFSLLELDPYCQVIKPMMESFSPLSTERFAISSSFETSVGTKALCSIHQKTSSKFKLGVDTLRYLESTLFPYQIDKGLIHFDPFDSSTLKKDPFLCKI